jgi:hypothetical protein
VTLDFPGLSAKRRASLVPSPLHPPSLYPGAYAKPSETKGLMLGGMTAVVVTSGAVSFELPQGAWVVKNHSIVS